MKYCRSFCPNVSVIAIKTGLAFWQSNLMYSYWLNSRTTSFEGQTKLLLSKKPVYTCFVIHLHCFQNFLILLTIKLLLFTFETRCVCETQMPPIMVISKYGQGHKDNYLDTSRKILSRQMLMYDMKALMILI